MLVFFIFFLNNSFISLELSEPYNTGSIPAAFYVTVENNPNVIKAKHKSMDMQL